MIWIAEKVEAIKVIARIGLDRLERLTRGLTKEQLDWRPCPEFNSLRWILTHEAYILHVAFPRILMGDGGYKPEGWPDDYVGNKSYSLEKILRDLVEGKAELLERLSRHTV